MKYENGFVKFPRWLIARLPEIQGDDFKILLLVAEKNNFDDPKMEFSCRYISKKTGISRSQVSRRLKSLSMRGLLKRLQVGMRSIGRYQIPASAPGDLFGRPENQASRQQQQPGKPIQKPNPTVPPGIDPEGRLSHSEGTVTVPQLWDKYKSTAVQDVLTDTVPEATQKIQPQVSIFQEGKEVKNFEEVKEEIRMEIGDVFYRTFVKPVKAHIVGDGKLAIYHPADWDERMIGHFKLLYIDRIEQHLDGKVVSVKSA